mmetsp:Transcript_4042/g.9667  ORF Transcript_4042/g.9667 Transcript_4042/m.9667 type:complete len:295 (+) Transcript_4042:434-1318(+)
MMHAAEHAFTVAGGVLVALREDTEYSGASVKDNNKMLARSADGHIDEILCVILVENGDLVHGVGRVHAEGRGLGAASNLLALLVRGMRGIASMYRLLDSFVRGITRVNSVTGEFPWAPLVHVELADLLRVSGRHVGFVLFGDADEDRAGFEMCEVKKDKVAAEQNVANEKTCESFGRALHARLVRLRKEPVIIWDFQCGAGDVQEERIFLEWPRSVIHDALPFRERLVFEESIQCRIRDNKARSATVHDSRKIRCARIFGREFEQLGRSVFQRESHRDVVTHRNTRGHEHMTIN